MKNITYATYIKVAYCNQRHAMDDNGGVREKIDCQGEASNSVTSVRRDSLFEEGLNP